MNARPIKTTDSVIVSFDYTHGKDKSVLLVGRKPFNKPVEIVNAFQGEEAEELWTRLTTVKEKKDDKQRDV